MRPFDAAPDGTDAPEVRLVAELPEDAFVEEPPKDSGFGCMRGSAEQLGDIVSPLSKEDWGSLV